MSYQKTADGDVYERLIVVNPAFGTIDYWADQTVELAKQDKANRYALLFNGRLLRVGLGFEPEKIRAEYWKQVNRD